MSRRPKRSRGDPLLAASERPLSMDLDVEIREEKEEGDVEFRPCSPRHLFKIPARLVLRDLAGCLLLLFFAGMIYIVKSADDDGGGEHAHGTHEGQLGGKLAKYMDPLVAILCIAIMLGSR